MRAIYVLIVTLLFATGYLQAQGIVFEQGNWTDVLKKAKKQKKLIFVHFDKPDCGTCSNVASIAFNSSLIREKFAQHFISFRTDGTTGIGKELAEKLEVVCLPSSVYLDTDESLLSRFCGSTSFDRAYLEKAEEAIKRKSEQPLAELAEAYKSGNRSSTLMRTYIGRLREMDLSLQDVLDDYIQSLPADSLQSADLMRFILEQGPVVGSKADLVLQRNYARTDSLYRAAGWNKAIEYNNRIINNSLRKAVKEKDDVLASRTATFKLRTYRNDLKAGTGGYEWVMMRYFKGIQDTLQYLRTASSYYDSQFMTARVDSIQKLDELDNQRRMRGEMPVQNGTNKVSIKPGQISFMLNPNTQRYVGALNEAAWDFQQMTRDPVYLEKALTWSKRSLEYREDGSLLDTYAHILYRLGRKSEAVEWQEKAVRKEKERSSPMVPSFEETLKKMKTGTL
ncbi:hypothetical protein [Spirosoma sp.]|uniref:hypothetical protein n=1 Tax=Spirosoma sp. TaxID=1899569 RepID=UPI003B3B2622